VQDTNQFQCSIEGPVAFVIGWIVSSDGNGSEQKVFTNKTDDIQKLRESQAISNRKLVHASLAWVKDVEVNVQVDSGSQ
jgi:hypothetical protein